MMNCRRAASAAFAFAAICVLMAGCDDSVAPAPTGQLGDGGGGGGGFDTGAIANDVPVVRSNTGFGSGSSHAAPDQSHEQGGGSSAKPPASGTGSLGEGFYTAAAEAAPKGPAGAAVGSDDRAAEAIEKAANDYPALATFDRSAAQSLPAPDPKATYASIVDPAEGEMPNRDEPIEIGVEGSEVDGVHFSSPAGGQVVLLTHVSEPGQPGHGRLIRYDIAKGKSASQVDLPDRAVLLDVSPDGLRALVRLTFGLNPDDRPVASQTRLDVWELTEAEGRHIVGWEPGAKEDGAAAVPIGAAFLDGDRVVTLAEDGALTLWNLAESKAVYTIQTGGRGPLLVTPGRKFVVLFTGMTFGGFEAATGAFRGLLTPPRQTLAGCRDAAFSPDGAQLAAVLRRPAQSVVAWDVKTGRTANEVDATLGLGRGLHFGSPGYVVAGGTLFDLAAKKPVWLYTENTNCRNVPVSPDRRHWAITHPTLREPGLEAVEAPTEEVATAARTAVALAAPRLGPGGALAVRLNLADFAGDEAAFETALAKSLARVLGERGLRLDAGAELTLAIDADEQTTGETISFSSVGIGADETVPAHEIALSLAVVDSEDKPLWTDTGRVTPNTLLARGEGKSLEAILLEELWRSAPAAIAAEVDRSMPAYLRNTPAESVLGQTRLWAGADNVSPPGDAPLAANNAERENPNDLVASAPSRKPATIFSAADSGSVRDLLVAPTYHWLMTATDDRAVRFWDPRTLGKVDEVKSRTGITRMAVHPSGAQFVFGTEDGQVRLYDLARKSAAAAPYEGAGGAVTAVAVTAEPTIVAGTQAGRVMAWQENDRAKPTVIADGQAAVTGLAAVPYENRVVATWADGTAKLVDAGTGEAVVTFDVQEGPIHGVAISPDARTAALATEAGGAVLVSLETGEETGRFDQGSVTAAAYRPEGLQFATANRHGRVVLWTVATKKPRERLDGAGGQVTSIVFSAEGLGVAAAVAGRRAVPVWNLGTPVLGRGASDETESDPDSGHDAPFTAHDGPRTTRGMTGALRGPAAHGR
jgi:WD40 repeat protein